MDRSTLYDVRSGAAWITLDRPHARNALNDALLSSLDADLDQALADDAVRCIVLTGAGPAFCSGADLKASQQGAAATGPGPPPFVRILSKLWNAPKPVIAAINGSAFAGGLGLVAAADIALAADHAKFSFSEVRIGVIPAVISVVCLPKLGPHHGMRLFLTGETFDAAAAVAYGLVHRSVAAEALQDAVAAEVSAIRRGGPHALAEAKRLVRRISGPHLDEAFAWTSVKSAELFASPEAAEGMAAFREKRPAAWLEG